MIFRLWLMGSHIIPLKYTIHEDPPMVGRLTHENIRLMGYCNHP
jgi:hypothetical protein